MARLVRKKSELYVCTDIDSKCRFSLQWVVAPSVTVMVKHNASGILLLQYNKRHHLYFLTGKLCFSFNNTTELNSYLLWTKWAGTEFKRDFKQNNVSLLSELWVKSSRRLSQNHLYPTPLPKHRFGMSSTMQWTKMFVQMMIWYQLHYNPQFRAGLY